MTISPGNQPFSQASNGFEIRSGAAQVSQREAGDLRGFRGRHGALRLSRLAAAEGFGAAGRAALRSAGEDECHGTWLSTELSGKKTGIYIYIIIIKSNISNICRLYIYI